jgi:hypothetical protein
MAVRVFCDNPTELLGKIKKAIREAEVETWLLDSDGDFTHSPAQWKNKAWFRASVETDRIVFYIFGRKAERMSKEIYAIYHGRFIEMLLAHFDTKFSRATATALPTGRDYVGDGP